MIEFIWALLAIVLIDVVLGGENAIVIALASRNLEPSLRKKALLYGTLGAVAVRFLCVAILTYLLMIPGLRLIGGMALVYIAWQLVKSNTHDDNDVKAANTFWGAMATIVWADAVMGLDNALAIAGAAGGNWYLIIFGLLLSVPIILFGSTIVVKVIEKYPSSIYIGSFVLFVVAFKMIVSEPFIDQHIDPLHDWAEKGVPWILAIILLFKQYYRNEIRVKK